MGVTLELTLAAILIGAIGISSPTRLAFSVVMLSSSSEPWGRAVAYALGSTAVFTVAALNGLLGVQAPGAEGAESAINVVLGIVMIATAIAMLVLRRRGRTLSLPTSGHPLMAAAGLGAAVSIRSFGRLLILLAGGYRLGAVSGGPIPCPRGGRPDDPPLAGADLGAGAAVHLQARAVRRPRAPSTSGARADGGQPVRRPRGGRRPGWHRSVPSSGGRVSLGR